MALEPSVMSMCLTEQPNMALQPSVMSMYPTGHPNLAKEPSVMPHYISVLLIIRPIKPDPLCDVLVPLHVPHILPGLLREVLVLLCAPDGVTEHFKDVHLQFLALTKTGKMSILANFLLR
jgi:hypothetical protein